MKPSELFPPNGDGIVRISDPWGDGTFMASRGTRRHRGIDLVTVAGQDVYAPFDCVVGRHGYAYADLSYRLVEIRATGDLTYTAKIMYVTDMVPVGTKVKRGEVLAKAADITARFDARMINHIHFELYQHGKVIDPTPLILPK